MDLSDRPWRRPAAHSAADALVEPDVSQASCSSTASAAAQSVCGRSEGSVRSGGAFSGNGSWATGCLSPRTPGTCANESPRKHRARPKPNWEVTSPHEVSLQAAIVDLLPMAPATARVGRSRPGGRHASGPSSDDADPCTLETRSQCTDELTSSSNIEAGNSCGSSKAPSSSPERATAETAATRSVWDPQEWCRRRAELLKSGEVRQLHGLLHEVRQSTGFANSQGSYRLGDKHIALPSTPTHSAARVHWYGHANAGIAPSAPGTDGAIPPPVLVCDTSALDVATRVRSIVGATRPIILVTELSDFDVAGGIDTTRAASVAPACLPLRSDFADSSREAGSQLWGGTETMRSHLCALHDPYVFLSRAATVFRGPREEGFPFLEEPVRFHLLATALPDTRPPLQVVRGGQPGGRRGAKTEWYADEVAHAAVLERLHLVGLVALNHARSHGNTGEEQEEGRPVLVFGTLGCGGGRSGRHPRHAVANALKYWRRRFASLFHSVYVCTGGDDSSSGNPRLASLFDRIINRQVYKMLERPSLQAGGSMVPWHWDSRQLELCARPDRLESLAALLRIRDQACPAATTAIALESFAVPTENKDAHTKENGAELPFMPNCAPAVFGQSTGDAPAAAHKFLPGELLQSMRRASIMVEIAAADAAGGCMNEALASHAEGVEEIASSSDSGISSSSGSDSDDADSDTVSILPLDISQHGSHRASQASETSSCQRDGLSKRSTGEGLQMDLLLPPVDCSPMSSRRSSNNSISNALVPPSEGASQLGALAQFDLAAPPGRRASASCGAARRASLAALSGLHCGAGGRKLSLRDYGWKKPRRSSIAVTSADALGPQAGGWQPLAETQLSTRGGQDSSSRCASQQSRRPSHAITPVHELDEIGAYDASRLEAELADTVEDLQLLRRNSLQSLQKRLHAERSRNMRRRSSILEVLGPGCIIEVDSGSRNQCGDFDAPNGALGRFGAQKPSIGGMPAAGTLKHHPKKPSDLSTKLEKEQPSNEELRIRREVRQRLRERRSTIAKNSLHSVHSGAGSLAFATPCCQGEAEEQAEDEDEADQAEKCMDELGIPHRRTLTQKEQLITGRRGSTFSEYSRNFAF